MVSTISKGDKFRASVVDLLKMSGVHEIQTEVLFGSKKVDIIFKRLEYGKFITYGVECKGHARSLSKGQIVQIRSGYEDLLDDALIDELLIVSRGELGGVAKRYVMRTKQLRHMTYLDLQNIVMDFSRYLKALIASYQDLGFTHYYVRPQLSTHKDLETFVDQWMLSPTTTPLALLASYGMGKTSFAMHLAAKYAALALKNGESRIPILIRLGEISAEQTA